MSRPERRSFDQAEYIRYLQLENAAGRCYICGLVKEAPGPSLVYRNETCIAFLSPYPRLLGYIFVAPIEHRTAAVEDFSEEEYVELQRHIYRLGRAVSAAVPTERLYVLSFGSNMGLAHVHWHLAPLPPGTVFDKQQFEAISDASYYHLTDGEQRELAERIAKGLPAGS